jgi:hypothetical protein
MLQLKRSCSGRRDGVAQVEGAADDSSRHDGTMDAVAHNMHNAMEDGNNGEGGSRLASYPS